ncbi:MAG: hypothetical protein QHC67_03555 [Sphingobium sp.]|uniref:hypothetical protein n=1 Tax=Sphingobium sp. TaxID=1912891 RepID=UPI0029AB97C2|nr:hypothetical protein [Sphingobium sp.]MDX3908875.1 hypothetical protein [Sphingobium sp.]
MAFMKVVEASEPERRAFPPMPPPLLISCDGKGWFPDPFMPCAFRLTTICAGLAMGWAEAPELGGAVLNFVGGNENNPTDEAVAVTLTREGLRNLIRDLVSIDAQLEQDHG